MAHYLDENELKEEVLNIQKTQKIRSLLVDYNNLKQYARYKREKQELRNIKREIIALYRVGANPEYSTNKFGGMIMLLLQRIASKSNFSGYSWREEFYGDATEKIFKYLHNFNPDLISKISGEPVKAFAYLTQIATMSFLSIINKYNDELACVKNFIPMMEFNEKIDKGLLYSKSDIEEDNTITNLKALIVDDKYKSILETKLLAKVKREEILNKDVSELHILSKLHNLNYNEVISELYENINSEVEIDDFNSLNVTWIIISFFFENKRE
jgi:hypothetical protein